MVTEKTFDEFKNVVEELKDCEYFIRLLYAKKKKKEVSIYIDCTDEDEKSSFIPISLDLAKSVLIAKKNDLKLAYSELAKQIKTEL